MAEEPADIMEPGVLPSIDDPPRRRRLAWEHELYESHGFFEKSLTFIPDLWKRGGGWMPLAVLAAPFWVVAAIIGLLVSLLAILVVGSLAATAVVIAFGAVVYVGALLVAVVITLFDAL